MAIRHITLYIDVDNTKLVNLAGGDLSQPDMPHVYYGEIVILHCHFRATDLSPYPLTSDELFETSIDSNFVHSDTLMAYSDNDAVNMADDWNAVDMPNGKISIRINCHTDSFRDKIGSDDEQYNYIEIKKTYAGNQSVMCQSRINCHNVIDAGGAGPLPLQNYFTEDEVNATFMKINDFNVTNPANVNIINNEITKIGSNMVLIPETPHDELNIINGGIIGQTILIRNQNDTDIITLKNATGNILCPSGYDIELTGFNVIILTYDGTNWKLITFDDDVYPSYKSTTNNIDTYDRAISINECDGRFFSNSNDTITDVHFELPTVQDKLLFSCINEDENKNCIIVPQLTDKIRGVGIQGEVVRVKTDGAITQLRGTDNGWFVITNRDDLEIASNEVITMEIYNDSHSLLWNGNAKPYYGSITDNNIHCIEFDSASFAVQQIAYLKFTSTNPTGVNNASITVRIEENDNSISDMTFLWDNTNTRWNQNTTVNAIRIDKIFIKFNV